MTLYLDSALVSEAKIARSMGWVTGITTNPTLLANSEHSPETTLRQLASLIPGEIFYQLTAPDLDGMLAEAKLAYQILGKQTVIKIPASPAGFQTLAQLSNEIPCAITAIFHPAQALVARAGGARYAIAYVNRSTRLLGDGVELIREMVKVCNSGKTKILAASIKSPDEAVATFSAGAHVLTLPLNVLQALPYHPLSDDTFTEFAQQGSGLLS